jgi:hypothetical protein
MARWFPFEHFRDNGWDDEPVESCYLGRIYHYWSGRNAWYGTVNRYPGFASFGPGIADTKFKIERKRVQGSQWHIAERPVLVFTAQANSLIVGEINLDEPLWRFAHYQRELKTLEEFGRCFEPHRPDSVIRIVSSSGLLPVATQPFRVHHSQPHGTRELPLWWRASVVTTGVNRTRRLAGRIDERLKRMADARAPV